MTSPSKIRRYGRDAYYRGGDPAVLNPYRPGECNYGDWLDGWNQARKDDEIKQAEEAQAEIDLDEKVEEFARLYNLAKDRGLIS